MSDDHSRRLRDEIEKQEGVGNVRGLNISDTSNYYYPKLCTPNDQIKYLYPLFEAESAMISDDGLPAGSVVKVEYQDNYRRNIGMGGLLTPTGKVIEIISLG